MSIITAAIAMAVKSSSRSDENKKYKLSLSLSLYTGVTSKNFYIRLSYS